MFKKCNDLRNQILELIAEGQIDREFFPKKDCNDIGRDYVEILWKKDEFSFKEDTMKFFIPIMNVTTKKIYKNTQEAEKHERLHDFEIHELCINGRKFYNGSRYAYVDYKGQPIIHEGHYKNHWYPHKPSCFNILGYTGYLIHVGALVRYRRVKAPSMFSFIVLPIQSLLYMSLSFMIVCMFMRAIIIIFRIFEVYFIR